MSKHTFYLLLVGCLATGALWAANDAFIGKWKLNASKSQLVDEMRVESAGANKYTFIFGNDPETIVVDGTDQPGGFGSTLSVSADGPNTWKVVRKKDGRTIISAIWTLSADGQSLRDDFTGYPPNGSTYHLDYLYKRTAGSSGFAGTWESASEKVDSVVELNIQPWKEDGLSFINLARGSTRNLEFDGKDYPNGGPGVVPGAASSGKRVDERTLELTDKIQGRIYDTQQVSVSPDLKKLTMTVHPAGHTKPNVFVFDRE